jgi:preprotein translocase SecE subunit
MSRRERQRRRRAANPGPAPSEPHRDNVPGPLEHASGEVDEFEAALVAGAGGEPQVDDDPAAELDTISEAELEEDFDESELERAEDDEELLPPRARRPSRARPTAAQPAGHAGGNRALGFLRACWAELQRVQWPDRRQVGQATAVVIGFVVIAGAYLGLADVVAQHVIDFII